MKLTEHTRRNTGETYYVIRYQNDDEGFYIWKRANLKLYPLAVLVYPKTSGWLAKINWAGFNSPSQKVVVSQVFTVADKQIEAINETDIPDSTHRALWLHCSMLLLKHHRDEQTKKASILPPGSAALLIPPVWQVWRKPTVAEFYEMGEELF